LTAETESVGAEVQSKIRSSLIAAFSFAKAVWLVWVSPVQFLRSSFTGAPPLSTLPFPLASIWRVADRGPQKVTAPFHALAIAIGLVAVLGPLERAAWNVNDFGQRTFGVSTSETRERTDQRLKEFYESVYGRKFYVVDSAHLTGVDFVDRLLEEILGLLNYAYFTLVAVPMLVRGGVKRYQVVHAYVYTISAAITASVILDGLGLIPLAIGAMTGSISTVALSGLGQGGGYLLIIYFVVILPIRILPKVLNVSRSSVVVATCVAAFTWLVSRYVFFTVLPGQLGFVWR
jgi:hypothetical protein